MADELFGALARARRQHTWLLRLWLERPTELIHDELVQVRQRERELEQADWVAAARPIPMRWW